jgi:hypothetical protein
MQPTPGSSDARPIGESWRVRAVNVRECNRGLRWALEAERDGVTAAVTADTSGEGVLSDLQRDGYAGTTGDAELDHEVRKHIADVFALRTVLQSLNAIDRRRWGRVQQPRDRRRWAA